MKKQISTYDEFLNEGKGRDEAQKIIQKLRSSVFKKLNDDELEEFRKELALAFDLKESTSIKSFDEWVLENAQFNKTSIDNPGAFTYPTVIGEDEESNYMFFSNLSRIKKFADMLLDMDKSKIDTMLNDGHDWANDHVTKAKENLNQVFDFFYEELGVNESVDTSNLNRSYSMDSEWWTAWRYENEEAKDLKITQDEYSKSFTVRNSDGDILLVFDYVRGKLFTNESPSMFIIKNSISAKQMDSIEAKSNKLDNIDDEDPEKTKKEKEAVGAKTTDATEEE